MPGKHMDRRIWGLTNNNNNNWKTCSTFWALASFSCRWDHRIRLHSEARMFLVPSFIQTSLKTRGKPAGVTGQFEWIMKIYWFRFFQDEFSEKIKVKGLLFKFYHLFYRFNFLASSPLNSSFVSNTQLVSRVVACILLFPWYIHVHSVLILYFLCPVQFLSLHSPKHDTLKKNVFTFT